MADHNQAVWTPPDPRAKPTFFRTINMAGERLLLSAAVACFAAACWPALPVAVRADDRLPETREYPLCRDVAPAEWNHYGRYPGPCIVMCENCFSFAQELANYVWLERRMQRIFIMPEQETTLGVLR